MRVRTGRFRSDAGERPVVKSDPYCADVGDGAKRGQSPDSGISVRECRGQVEPVTHSGGAGIASDAGLDRIIVDRIMKRLHQMILS